MRPHVTGCDSVTCVFWVGLTPGEAGLGAAEDTSSWITTVGACC